MWERSGRGRGEGKRRGTGGGVICVGGGGDEADGRDLQDVRYNKPAQDVSYVTVPTPFFRNHRTVGTCCCLSPRIHNWP